MKLKSNIQLSIKKEKPIKEKKSKKKETQWKPPIETMEEYLERRGEICFVINFN